MLKRVPQLDRRQAHGIPSPVIKPICDEYAARQTVLGLPGLQTYLQLARVDLKDVRSRQPKQFSERPECRDRRCTTVKCERTRAHRELELISLQNHYIRGPYRS